MNAAKELLTYPTFITNKSFSKEDVEMASKLMKRFSTSLDSNKMQIKTTVRHYYHLLE